MQGLLSEAIRFIGLFVVIILLFLGYDYAIGSAAPWVGAAPGKMLVQCATIIAVVWLGYRGGALLGMFKRK